MKSYAKQTTLAAMSAVLILAASSAFAQKGMLEIHGVLTSPGCTLSQQTVLQLSQQTSINGQACGLTSGPANPLSSLSIARIVEESLPSAQGTGSGKRIVTLTYR
jgi:type 1 fimbria pilin